MAWCTDCVQPGMTESSWACLPAHMLPSSLREQAHLISNELSRSNFDSRPSHFGPCPLCGLGEAGAEHIWQWCSAAHMAWARCGDGSSWRDALAGRCNDRLRLTIVASQVIFLYTSLVGRTCMNPDDSTRRIVAAIHAIVATDDIPIVDGENDVGEHLQVDADTWALSSECMRCNRGEPNLCCISNMTHSTDSTRGAHEHARTGATVSVRVPVDTGRNLATMHADNTPARWMVVSPQWWPQPLTTHETHANCEWLTSRCRHCGRREACLFARRSIRAGEELTVPRPLAPISSAALVPYEVFFDGGTCNRNGNSATGAGALLWYIHSSGPPTCIARAIFAAPGDNSAVIAESHACGLALSLLTSLAREHWGTHGSTLRARLVGDCIPVIRYASAQSRFRSADQRAHIDHGLRQTSEIGWNIEWQVINRRHNTHAHALARIAAVWANNLCREGRRDHCSVFEWRGSEHTSCNHFTLPAWP